MFSPLRSAGSNNPLFMLDEIDKLGMDFRGDPASALLEVLDPEQNFSFSDHYLEVPFDLSKVMFITTANYLEPVPPALKDRMEVIELAGYTEEEKLEIAKRHIIPKQVVEHGLTDEQIEFADEAVLSIAGGYTHEAGVRNLEREIGAVCRKVARGVTEGNTDKVTVTQEKVSDLLGPIKFFPEVAERTQRPGVAIGLAWTPNGGDILFIEATPHGREKGPDPDRPPGRRDERVGPNRPCPMSALRPTNCIFRPTFMTIAISISMFPRAPFPKTGLLPGLPW